MIVVLFDENGNTHKENLRFYLNTPKENSRPYSLKVKLNENDKTYRIAFYVKARRENNKGYFYFHDLDVIFR